MNKLHSQNYGVLFSQPKIINFIIFLLNKEPGIKKINFMLFLYDIWCVKNDTLCIKNIIITHPF